MPVHRVSRKTECKLIKAIESRQFNCEATSDENGKSANEQTECHEIRGTWIVDTAKWKCHLKCLSDERVEYSRVWFFIFIFCSVVVCGGLFVVSHFLSLCLVRMRVCFVKWFKCKINENSACPKIHSIIYLFNIISFGLRRRRLMKFRCARRPSGRVNGIQYRKVLRWYTACEFFMFFFVSVSFFFCAVQRVETPQANWNVRLANASIHQYIVIGDDTTLYSVARSIRRTTAQWQSSNYYRQSVLHSANTFNALPYSCAFLFSCCSYIESRRILRAPFTNRTLVESVASVFSVLYREGKRKCE